MEDVLKAVAAGFAAVATLVGIFGALEGLTVRARLRRRSLVADELAKMDPSPRRREALHEVRDVGLARLLAAWHIPTWRFVQPVATVIVMPTFLAFFVYISDEKREAAVFACLSLVLLTIQSRRLVRLVTERQRISLAFARREAIQPARLSLGDDIEYPRREWVLAIMAAAGLVAASIGAGLLVRGTSDANGLGLLFVGSMVAWTPVDNLRNGSLRPGMPRR